MPRAVWPWSNQRCSTHSYCSVCLPLDNIFTFYVSAYFSWRTAVSVLRLTGSHKSVWMSRCSSSVGEGFYISNTKRSQGETCPL